jgi:hypothetical protein
MEIVATLSDTAYLIFVYSIILVLSYEN